MLAWLCQKAFSVLVNDIFSKHALTLDIYPFLYVGSDIVVERSVERSVIGFVVSICDDCS